jgi:hypothetical protein
VPQRVLQVIHETVQAGDFQLTLLQLSLLLRMFGADIPYVKLGAPKGRMFVSVQRASRGDLFVSELGSHGQQRWRAAAPRFAADGHVVPREDGQPRSSSAAMQRMEQREQRNYPAEAGKQF